jgi:cytoskeletal protein CcmA (bactofilin family)
MKGIHHGDLTIEGRFEGMLNGTAIVPAGATAEIAGMIDGTLIVEPGATVLISGMVDGNIIDRGGHITVTGMLGR